MQANNFYIINKYSLFFYKKYFLFSFIKKNSRFNYYAGRAVSNYLSSIKQSIVLNFFSRRLQLLTFLTEGFYSAFNFFIYSISKNCHFISLLFFLFNLILGFSRSFKSKLYLVGLRVRIEKIYRKSLILKLNLCHKVKWKFLQSKFWKFRKAKNSFVFKTKDFYLHNLFLYTIRRFKLPDIYKGNGIRFYKEKIKFKKRKQFGVF